MKILVSVLSVLLALLSYRALFGDGSVQQLNRLHGEVREARAELVRLKSRNQNLQAEVDDLKNGLDAVEERARIELGMIGADETFFHFVKQPGSDSQSSPAAGNAQGSAGATESDKLPQQ